MVGVEDEQHVERVLESRIGLVLEFGDLVDHRQEVARVTEVVVRIDVRHAAVVAVGEGGQRRHLRQQPDHLEVADLGVLDRARLGVEGRQRADGGQQHPHRMRVVAEALHELLDVLVHERVERDLAVPHLELGLGRQLAVHQQVGDFEIRRLLGELLDRVSAVFEDPPLAIDERDRRPARRGRHVGRVVRHQAEVVVAGLDLAQLGRADRPVLDRDLVLLAGPVVRDGERVGRRGYAAVRWLLSLGGHSTPVSYRGLPTQPIERDDP